jgi:hypothetical protein
MDQDEFLRQSELKNLLRKSGDELDQIVKKISDAISDGQYLSAKDLE